LRADLNRQGISAKAGEAKIFETLHEAIAAARAGGSATGAEGQKRPLRPSSSAGGSIHHRARLT
jgi:hypothetical protein